MRCIYPQGAFVQGKVLTLNRSESHHLIKVMRARVGDSVELLDGRGEIAYCRLEEEHPKKASVRIEETVHHDAPVCPIEIAQAIPKGKKMDMIVQKATEIGTSQIYPLLSERTEVRLDGLRQQSKQEHWEEIASQSCKQCGNPFLPSIHPIQSLKQFFQHFADTKDEDTVGLIASLEPQRSYLRPVLNKRCKRVVCLIGPEGDFSAEEYQMAAAIGFKPIQLARHVLRSDTAAIYMLSLIDYELQLSLLE